ncbi:MAG: purN 2 [Candidatus Eremiobacteraeota bacterium]|nr:purN 2 [Candidatus Eremiobacteraeota bacterium]
MLASLSSRESCGCFARLVAPAVRQDTTGLSANYEPDVKIAVWGSGSIYEAAIRACLRHEIEIAEADDCDVLLLANYTRMLKAPDRALPRVGALCFHPSVLPKHRGRDAVYWTVKMGDPTCGVSWFWIDAGIDTGDVAATVEVARPDVRPRELYEETLVPLGEMLLDTLLGQFKRGVFSRFAQDERFATYEPPRDRPAATTAER